MNDLLFPVVLCGTHRVVRRELRKVVRKAVKTSSWTEALDGREFVPIDETPGDLMLDGPSPLMEGDHTLLYLIRAVMSDATKDADRDKWFASFRDLVFDGLPHFWFALSLLGGQPWLPRRTSFDSQVPDIERRVIRAILRWWPEISRLDDRFSTGGAYPAQWPFWGLAIFSRLRELGVPTEFLNNEVKTLAPRVAREEIEKLVNASENGLFQEP